MVFLEQVENKINQTYLSKIKLHKGKTYYIRYLINELQEKNMIYFPSDIIRILPIAEFRQIIKPYSHSIIIIDDVG